MRRSPRGPFLLASEANGSWSPVVGKDGKHVYFYGFGAQGDLQLYDAASRKLAPFLPLAHLAVTPATSRDGAWIAFSQLDTGVLWRTRPDGTEPHQITAAGLSAGFPRWSPDGHLIAFAGHKLDEEANAYVIASNGGEPQILVPGTIGLSDPDWSPDGSMIVVLRSVSGAAAANE